MDRAARRRPAYDEIPAPEPQRKKSHEKAVNVSEQGQGDPREVDVPEGELEMVEEEEEFDDLNDRFESSYNFRFEEP